MYLDPKIWGPHYWFVLHTIALNYPLNPTDIIKKKYYDFILNLPLFIPINDISNKFSKFLDEFPVTPYLDSRESFIKWIYFIHNKINISLDLPELSLEESFRRYFKNYESEIDTNKKNLIKKKYIYYTILIILLIIILFYLYYK